jgi:hypothetical protein
LITRPYELWGKNFITFFNECAVSINLYLMLTLTDNTEAQINPTLDSEILLDVANYRVGIAWALVALLSGTILINFIFSSLHMLKSLISLIKDRLKNRKLQTIKLKPIEVIS